jgi:hypothetical protein
MFRDFQRNRPDDFLEQQVRHNFEFLFVEHEAQITSNVIEIPGVSELTLAVGNLEFKFSNNDRDGDHSVLVAPRNANGVWEMLHIALAAATGEEAESLMVPAVYDRESRKIKYVEFARISEILKPRFSKLDFAFRPENYPSTHSRMVQLERQIHPR